MKFLYTPTQTNDVLFAVIGNPWLLLLFYLLLINLATFLAFGLDKWKAKRKEKKDSVRRIPEKRLFLLCAFGGSIGALWGMKVFHHKTLHKAFRFGIPVILVLQILIPLGLYVYIRFIR